MHWDFEEGDVFDLLYCRNKDAVCGPDYRLELIRNKDKSLTVDVLTPVGLVALAHACMKGLQQLADDGRLAASRIAGPDKTAYDLGYEAGYEAGREADNDESRDEAYGNGYEDG